MHTDTHSHSSELRLMLDKQPEGVHSNKDTQQSVHHSGMCCSDMGGDELLHMCIWAGHVDG